MKTNLVNTHEEVFNVDNNTKESVQLVLPNVLQVGHMVTWHLAKRTSYSVSIIFPRRNRLKASKCAISSLEKLIEEAK